jgi:hypothetical protein
MATVSLGSGGREVALRGRIAEVEDILAAPVRLEDSYGSAWVEPDTRQLELDVEPVELSADEFREQVPGLSLPDPPSQRERRYLVYELRGGDEVWMSGEVSGVQRIFNADELVLDPSGPPLQPIGLLLPGPGRVRVSARIAEIATAPVGRPGQPDSGTAWLRLRAEQPASGGWEAVLDALQAQPFRLEDDTGSLWADPVKAEPDAFGEGALISDQEADAVLARMRRYLPASAPARLRYVLWERRLGDTAEIVGFIAERPGPSGLPQPVLVLSPGRLSVLDRLRGWKPSLRQVAVCAALLALGLIFSCAGLFQLLAFLTQ